MRNVYVLGTGMIKFGRYPEKTVPELGGEAALLALKDAGIANQGRRDVRLRQPLPVQRDGRASASCSRSARPAFPSSTSPTPARPARPRFARPTWRSPRGCTTSRWRSASSRWASRDCSAVAAAEPIPPTATEGRLGSGLMPAVFGQAGIEHMRKYGTKMEHFAKISVKSHQARHQEPVLAVSQRGHARRRDERPHGRVSQHALHVLPDRRRRRGGDPGLRGQAQAVAGGRKRARVAARC